MSVETRRECGHGRQRKEAESVREGERGGRVRERKSEEGAIFECSRERERKEG